VDIPDEAEVLIMPLLGWVEDDQGAVTHWIFRTGMNSNWYVDGNVKLAVDSDIILGFKTLSFDMF
jgi:hypothetical protein